MTTFLDLPLCVVLLIAEFCGPPRPRRRTPLPKLPVPEPERVFRGYTGPGAPMRSGWYFAPDF